MALLLVAHGSRDPRHAATVTALRDHLAASRPGLRVEVAYLDFCLPGAGQVLARLAAEGVREVIALPLLLTHAFHARTDIPAVLREATPLGLTVRQAEVLGPSPLLTTALERRLYEAGVRQEDRATTGVVLASAGSSDPRAIAVIEGLAREWQRTGGWQAVRPAYASAASPRVDEAVRALRAGGARRVAVAPYVIAPGRLPDRIARGGASASADVVAEPLGACPELVSVLLRRYEEARTAALAGCRRAG
ncbi:sirohydrochlorin chelatase [Streptomyces sp. UNOC14_S4]|uniref:sirohydrochlorin chelatase n=1 Tax=Streptomyces sp. UNOC14_S4 TaxID=2872340 RepID=UPI001E5B28A9|nr:sirohydrochlorin chelatase [Streptomyces sp. UNOC14_S4]MCC3767367.1 sirohydrochlorin chelatase [Streptomyces sp. UNOC14_S4]